MAMKSDEALVEAVLASEDRSGRAKARIHDASTGSIAARKATGVAQTGPQLALRFREAAQTLGISVESFERYVEPQLKLLRLGTMKLVPVCELQRFIDENSCRAGGDW